MTTVPRGNSVKISVQPNVDKSLNDAGQLRHLMKERLDKVSKNKPDIAKHQPRGSA